jgi:enoyl-CoA hydratase
VSETSADFADAVLLDIDDRVAFVTFNRPDRLNAWSWEMGMALHQRMEAIAANPEVRAVVLKGNGRSFCAGIDLKPDVRDRIVGRSPAEKVMNYYQRYRGSHRRTRFIEGIAQPVIAAIHGHCLGAGFEIAMLSDLRLAAEGTQFGCPEVKIGVAIDCGLDLRLAREIGASWAKWLTLTGRRIDASRALQLGIVQEVHPADELVAAATALAREIAANAPLAVQAVKRTIDRHANRGLDEALDFEALNAAVGFVSDDLVEGFAAGREKRAAAFEGK